MEKPLPDKIGTASPDEPAPAIVIESWKKARVFFR
jgi:hypothetical protein